MTGEIDLAGQFSAFVHAPIPYIAEAILVAGVAWSVSRAFTKDTMDALRERLSLATDRLRQSNEEAEVIRRKLSATHELLRSKAASGQIESAASVVEANVVALVRANNNALGIISAPYRRGDKKVAPFSSKGPASKPEARR